MGDFSGRLLGMSSCSCSPFLHPYSVGTSPNMFLKTLCSMTRVHNLGFFGELLCAGIVPCVARYF